MCTFVTVAHLSLHKKLCGSGAGASFKEEYHKNGKVESQSLSFLNVVCMVAVVEVEVVESVYTVDRTTSVLTLARKVNRFTE